MSTLPAVKIYTKKGDDGSTGLLYGGRVAKDGSGPEAYGAIDEAVSAMGVARAIAGEAPLGKALLEIQRWCFVAGAELATDPDNLAKLEYGKSRVPAEYATTLESWIDQLVDTRGMPTEFVVPGGNQLAAAVDVARTMVRRAERRAVTHLRSAGVDDSHIVPFLNRLADYLFMAARATEADWTPTRATDR